MSRFLDFNPSGIEPEEGAPPPERILSGSPEFRTWNLEENAEGTLFAGIWESTPGKWRIEYDEWEFCHILSGRSIVSEEGGGSREVGAGDSFVIRPGFKGSWGGHRDYPQGICDQALTQMPLYQIKHPPDVGGCFGWWHAVSYATRA